MRASSAITDLLQRSVDERIQIVQDLWDGIAADLEALSLTEAQKRELDRRMDDYHRHPEASSPWSVVRDRMAQARR
jgi:putative addiction module component (TIGR02574 family)